MKKVKHMLNAHEFPVSVELSDLPSLTIPDQSMSIRQIMLRYSRGLPIHGADVPMYQGQDIDFDNVLPHYKAMDISERAEFAEKARAYIKVQNEKRDQDIKDLEKRRRARADEFELWFQQRKTAQDTSVVQTGDAKPGSSGTNTPG